MVEFNVVRADSMRGAMCQMVKDEAASAGVTLAKYKDRDSDLRNPLFAVVKNEIDGFNQDSQGREKAGCFGTVILDCESCDARVECREEDCEFYVDHSGQQTLSTS